MTVEKVTNIKFIRPYVGMDAIFEIGKPTDICIQNGGTDITDINGNVFHKMFCSWRSIFDRNTKITIGCTIKFDDGGFVTGDFDLDELIKGNIVRTE